jgi:enoyl-CoA hydratase/carnithine racemase
MVLQRLLELPIPVVGVANGPATVALRVSARRRRPYRVGARKRRDFPHPTVGLTGGDGRHVVWEEIVGTARAKWLLWTGERIEAQTALQWGVVSEVVTHERALERNIEIARPGREPPLYRTLQKQTLNLNSPTDRPGLPFGMALEGLAAADLVPRPGPPDAA